MSVTESYGNEKDVTDEEKGERLLTVADKKQSKSLKASPKIVNYRKKFIPNLEIDLFLGQIFTNISDYKLESHTKLGF